jgi:hypothetical protein
MLFRPPPCFTLRLGFFFLRYFVKLVNDNDELLDCFGWLLTELAWCPPELFAEAELCEA